MGYSENFPCRQRNVDSTAQPDRSNNSYIMNTVYENYYVMFTCDFLYMCMWWKFCRNGSKKSWLIVPTHQCNSKRCCHVYISALIVTSSVLWQVACVFVTILQWHLESCCSWWVFNPFRRDLIWLCAFLFLITIICYVYLAVPGTMPLHVVIYKITKPLK